ncbi:MAG TPA: redoxin domain-containing protein [Candidatus Bathyarchaeia archaeon]
MLDSLFARVAAALISAMTLLCEDVSSLTVGLYSSSIYAQVNWFPSPSQKLNKPQSRSRSVASKAGVLFFVSPECRTCPDEVTKLERELTRIGLQYQIEGIFVGDPAQVGRYLAGLRTYPFNFELGLDMDGSIAKKYGVNAFPTAVIEVDGKRVVVTRASELSEKLR